MSVRTEVDESGFAIVDPGLEPRAVDMLLHLLEPIESTLQGAGRGGARDILRRVPAVRKVLSHPLLSSIVRSALGPEAFAVKGILFDKHPGANWKVPWHQDLTVAVQAPVSDSFATSLENADRFVTDVQTIGDCVLMPVPALS